VSIEEVEAEVFAKDGRQSERVKDHYQQVLKGFSEIFQ
jgi:hypothetical protein